MGMSQKVAFSAEKQPTWSQVIDLLARRSIPLQVRMIDGELALPDETPPHDWRELRVGVPAGMITLRREAEGVSLIIWGNADANLRNEWNALTWALAHLAGGRVQTESAAGAMSPEEFAQAFGIAT